MNKVSILLVLACMISGIAKGGARIDDTMAGIKSQAGYYATAAFAGIGTGMGLGEGFEINSYGGKQLNKPKFANNLKGSVGRLAMLGGTICAVPVGLAAALFGVLFPTYLCFVGAPALVNKCTGKSNQQNDPLLTEQTS